MRLSLLLLAAALASASAAEVREVYYQGPLTPSNITPTFDKGYLFAYEGYTLHAYAPDGSPLYSVMAQVSGAGRATIDNAAADSDGTVATAVFYEKGRRPGGGIAVFDRSGKQVRFFDTGKYLPTQVSFAEDHTIWTLGWQGAGASTENYFILRNYSQEGQEFGAFLPRSSFRAEPDPVGPNTGMWQLRAMGGRIGALFYQSSILQPGQSLPPMLWVELDLKGKELGRWEMGGEWAPLAFTRRGGLYRTGGGLSMFDRSANAWRKVGDASGDLLGADGDELVFLVRGTNTLRWVSTSAQ